MQRPDPMGCSGTHVGCVLAPCANCLLRSAPVTWARAVSPAVAPYPLAIS